jgi:hypothetical protein
MTGYIRLTNKRRNLGPKPAAGESVVHFDRKNPVLGNPHVLHDPNDDDERERVIATYKKDLEADWEQKGPKYHALVALANRVISGEHLAGSCWCAPKPCHGDLIIERVKEIVRAHYPDHPFAGVRPSSEPPAQPPRTPKGDF